MKFMVLPAAFALLFAAGSAVAPPADAKGCLKGAAVGGVAGHYAGHHAILGAVGGCIVGHHMAAKHAQEERADCGGRQRGICPGEPRRRREAVGVWEIGRIGETKRAILVVIHDQIVSELIVGNGPAQTEGAILPEKRTDQPRVI